MNIKCTQNIYKSANGVSNVTYYILVPEETEVRGIVQLSHGMCEYFSRYTAFAKYLCSPRFMSVVTTILDTVLRLLVPLSWAFLQPVTAGSTLCKTSSS